MGLLDWWRRSELPNAELRARSRSHSGEEAHGEQRISVCSRCSSARVSRPTSSRYERGLDHRCGLRSGHPRRRDARHHALLKWGDLTRLNWSSRLSVLDTTPLRRIVDKAIGGKDFCDLDIPFAAVACNVLTGEQVILREGPVSSAVTASSAVPGIFSPVEYGDALLVDGGTVANLPVRVARELGADYVVAVDIVPELDGSHRPHDMKDMLLMTFDIRSRATQAADEDAADCLICPALTGMPPWDFSVVEQMEALGRPLPRRPCRS
jgi:predicted acylesterase/phospholipase RssA